MGSNVSVTCPLCQEQVEKLVFRYHVDAEKQVIGRIMEQNPGWEEADGACGRCFDYYHTEIVVEQRALPGIGPHFPIRSADDFLILPTGLRLDADPRYTGKGVTICFIDSGFYPHPDLVAHQNRIRAIIDIPKNKIFSDFDGMDQSAAWHGTMTSVVCAGDGWLSNGLYKGIASDAELVLLKVQDEQGRIRTGNIAKALQWIIVNHEQFKIRIVNISVGADEPDPYQQSEVDQLAETLIQMGIVVIAAVGNDMNGKIKPPANAPNVISVGGANDENVLGKKPEQLYHSSYGNAGEALIKPEIIAPAIWVAAPILPGSNEQKESEQIHQLLAMNDDELMTSIERISDRSSLLGKNAPQLRIELTKKITAGKFISSHYMHVDGTSFAAPIVSAVVAQLLEANNKLSPAIIRESLLATANKLEGLESARQGYGLIDPRKALLHVKKRGNSYGDPVSPYIDGQRHRISFRVQHDCASQVALAGSFNHWAKDVYLMEPGANAVWTIEIPMLPAGRYHYKFLVDDRQWIEDVNNPFREPDGFSDFNSILLVEN